jgi:uncharacterized protein
MRWRGEKQSSNIEDRRGTRTGGRGLAIGGLGTVALVLIGMFLGVDPGVLLQGVQGVQQPGSTASPEPYQESAGEAERRERVAVVLADTEAVWAQLLGAGQYREPRLVLFAGAVDSGCGFAEAAMGPFYCPADERVFLDLSFFEEMQGKLGAGGDFAEAYVIAHEVGHHVQNLLGTSGRVHQEQQRRGGAEANQLSVRLELQADCLAGVWTHHAERMRGLLEAGDLEEALGAASAVGDDRLQQRSQGRVVPDSFTHGSSAQRMRWFRQGLESGRVEACDTFGADIL